MNSRAAGAIESRGDFAAAFGDALQLALAQRARRMVWVDADFDGWPLDDVAHVQQLTGWLRLPGRQLLLLAADYRALQREAPRFVACYRLWSHAIAACSPEQDAAASLPSLLLVEGQRCLRLLDRANWRGEVSDEPAGLSVWRDRVDALLQQSTSAWPVTTLGL
jgi:hypothetical protein